MWRLVASWEGRLFDRVICFVGKIFPPPSRPVNPCHSYVLNTDCHVVFVLPVVFCSSPCVLRFKTLEVWLRYGFLDFGRQPRSFGIFFGLERPRLFLPSVGGRGRREPAPHQPRGLNPAREDSPACVLGMHRNLPQRSRALPAASRKELSGRDCSSSLQQRTYVRTTQRSFWRLSCGMKYARLDYPVDDSIPNPFI